MTVRIALIGGFAVSGDGAPPAVRGQIPQGIVARLAVAAGDPIGAERLVRDLWESPPDEVLSSLRAHISRLRSRGWSSMLTGGRDGYRLAPETVAVDIDEFERLVAASSDDSAKTAEEALRLWRPDPLGWAREFPFARDLTARVQARHREAVLRLARLRLTDDPAATVGLLHRLGDRPGPDLETDLLLAEALARAGRAVDAIALLDGHAEDATRTDSAVLRLRDEIVRSSLGVEPVGHDDGPERIGIPAPVSPLVGREEELQAIRRGRQAARLLTLTGAAGVGKTRLAVESARRTPPGEDEVQWLADLTTVVAAEDVVALVADTVGASGPTLPAIQRVVGGRRGLLILDNAEHVLGAVAMVCADLLGTSLGLGIVVTSRESLRMSGERLIHVAPFLGDDIGDAVELFRQRAAAAGLAVDDDPRQRAAIERLCTALDGLPLAIELAASRVGALEPEALERVVTDLAPDAPAAGRHASIDTAIEWSIRLTSPSERTLLSQLAGFAGPFPLEAVSGVCRVADEDVVPLVVSLARRSIVHTLPGPGPRRFRLLRVVQQYVRRELPPADDGWRERHAVWFRDAARKAAQSFSSPDSRRAKATVRSLRADLDQALTWALGCGEREVAVGLVGALARFWAERGANPDALRVIDEALDLPGPALPDDEAAALRAAATIATVGGDPARVAGYVRRFQLTSATAADPSYALLACAMSAYFAAATGDAETADEFLARGESVRTEVAAAGDDWSLVDYLVIRGDVLRAMGRPAQALDVLGQAYRLANDLGHGWARGAACLVSGRTLIDVGRPDEALGILRSGVVRFLEAEEPPLALACATLFAVALVELRQAARAADLFGAIDALGQRFGYRGDGIDPGFAEDARGRLVSALPPARRDEAERRGRERSLEWLVGHLTP